MEMTGCGDTHVTRRVMNVEGMRRKYHLRKYGLAVSQDVREMDDG
jgi:hypothetical protein